MSARIARIGPTQADDIGGRDRALVATLRRVAIAAAARPPHRGSCPAGRRLGTPSDSVVIGLARRTVRLPASFDTPGVQFVDKQRKPDQRLLSFQILAQTEIENARQFTVRLNLEGEESPQLVKYNVLGPRARLGFSAG